MNRLKELREAKGLTQKEFGRIMNASQNTVSQWESGKRDIDTTRLKQFALFFNVSTDFILNSPTPVEIDGTLIYDPLIDAAQKALQSLSKDQLREIVNYIEVIKLRDSLISKDGNLDTYKLITESLVSDPKSNSSTHYEKANELLSHAILPNDHQKKHG